MEFRICNNDYPRSFFIRSSSCDNLKYVSSIPPSLLVPHLLATSYCGSEDYAVCKWTHHWTCLKDDRVSKIIKCEIFDYSWYIIRFCYLPWNSDKGRVNGKIEKHRRERDQEKIYKGECRHLLHWSTSSGFAFLKRQFITLLLAISAAVDLERELPLLVYVSVHN